MHIDSIKHNGVQTCIIENILESVGVMDLAIIHDENTVIIGEGIHLWEL